MHIFVPYADVERSLRCLDRKRLLRQLGHAVKCLSTIRLVKFYQDNPGQLKFPHNGNHPTVRSWKEATEYLKWYACRCSEIIRGTLVTAEGQPPKTRQWDEIIIKEHGGWVTEEPANKPFWWGSEPIHASHRAMLYRADSDHYYAFLADGVTIPDYNWPVPLLGHSSKKRLRHECPWAPTKVRRATQPKGLLAPLVLSFTELDCFNNSSMSQG